MKITKFLLIALLFLLVISFVSCEEAKATKTESSKTEEKHAEKHAEKDEGHEEEEEPEEIKDIPQPKNVEEVLKQFKERNSTDLFVRFIKISTEEAKEIAKVLETNDKIDRFVLTSNYDVKVDDLKIIAQGLSHNKNLRVFGLTKTKIGDDGSIPFVEALKGHAALQKFYLYSVGVTDKTMSSILANFKENTGLSKLVIIENKLNDTGIQILSNFVQEKESITDLTLRDTSFGPEGYKSLANLMKNSNVRKLDVSENQMDDESVELFSHALPLSKLTQLELSFNGLTAKSVEILSKGIEESKTIHKVDLSENKLYDEGAKIVANLISKNSLIEKIDLSNNNITNAGVKAILDVIESNKNLKKLYLYRNSITQELKELLEKNEERIKSEIGDELKFGKDDMTDSDYQDDEKDEGKEEDMKDDEGKEEGKEEEHEEPEEKPEDETKLKEHSFLNKKEKAPKKDEL